MLALRRGLFLVTGIFASALVYAETVALDDLFMQLKTAPDEVAARQIENSIWERWLQSGNDEVDAMMREAMRRRSSYDFAGALEVLNRVIAIVPDYPEVWNQRATVYFHQQEFEKSLQDVAKTLELEPRHFGAMAGRGVIRYFQGKPALAVQNILQAAEYHPYLKELEMFGISSQLQPR